MMKRIALPVFCARLRRPRTWAAFALAALLPLLATPTGAAAAAGPVKIGVLLPNTGPLTVVGQETIRGLELYLGKVGMKAGGREIVLIKEDSEGKPDVGLTKAKKLVERDGVHLILGPTNSAVGLAIRDYIDAQKVPLVVPQANTRILTAPASAGGRFSPWIIRLIETSDQGCYPMGGWMVKNTPYRKVIAMGADFVIGHHSAEAFMAGFKAAGGQVVKEIYPPLNTPDFAPYMAQITATPADFVWAWMGGSDSPRFVKQYQEYGLKGKVPLYGYNTLVDDVALPAMGDPALGIITVGHYTAAIDTPGNKAFVKEFENKHRIWPSRYAETGYTGAQLITQAVADLKGAVEDRAKMRDALLAAAGRINPPRGPIQFDKYQQVITDIYVMKVERRGDRLVNGVVEVIPKVSQEDTWKWWQKQ
jgi:branched-chain amino acid transport system substrate-binding protein